MIELQCIGNKSDGSYPPCLVSKYSSSATLEDICLGITIEKNMDLLVCPVDAMEYDGDTVVINNKCIDCNMCALLCENSNNKSALTRLSVYYNSLKLISSLPHLQLYLNLLDKDAQYYSEVTAKGYARSKRIDMVMRKGNNVTLYKVSGSHSKLNYYLRSYYDTAEYYSNLYPNIKFSVEILSNSEIDKSVLLPEFHSTLNRLLLYYTKGGI